MERVSYENFARLDLRVGVIKSIEQIAGKSRIVKGIIDIGNDIKTAIIGGAQFYTPDELVGRTVIVLVNMDPKTIAGIQSDAMLLAADVDGRPFWLTVQGDIRPGTTIK